MNEFQHGRSNKADFYSTDEGAMEQSFYRSWPYSRSIGLAGVWLVLSMVFSAPATQAQEDIVRIQSKAFAEESLRLLGIGQQRAAIIEALKGLPEPFTDDAISNYPEAWLSFYRAATALIAVTPYDGEMVAVANSDRTRVVLKGTLMAGERDLAAVAPSVLWDAENNREIAVVATATETNDNSRMFGYDLSTSPGSNLFSVAGAGSPVVRFFNIQDGTEVSRLQIPVQSIPFGFSPIGISPDGTMFAATSADTILAWDIATQGAPRTIAPQFSERGESFIFAQANWTSESDFIVTYTWLTGPRQGQFGLARVNQDGTVHSIDDEGPRVIWAVSQSSPVFVELIMSQGEWLIRDLHLDILGRMSGEVEPISFARDQTAIVAVRGMGGIFGDVDTLEPAAIYGLDGTPLQLEPEDYLGFSDLVFDEAGQVLALIGPTGYSATHLSGVAPNAADLYVGITESLTAEEEAILSAQRIGSDGTEQDASQARILESEQIASEAEAAMLKGRRHEAIMLALRALPHMPSQADFDTFERAHRALFRAYASRPAQFDNSEDFLTFFLSRVRFGPAGRKALYRRFDLEETTRNKFVLRGTILDMETGEAKEVDFSAIDPLGFTDLHFSPDGLAFAGVGRTDGRIHLFDASTGEVARFFDSTGDTTHARNTQIGFSPDGQYFAATVGDVSDSKFAIWAVESGQLLYAGAPFGGFATPLGWSHNGQLLVVESVFQPDGSPGPDNLIVWSSDGESTMIPLLRADGRPVDHCQYPAISHAQPYLACSADAETTIFNFATGNIVGTINRVDSVGTFLRDGSVIGWSTATNPGVIDVFSITGEPLEPILHDYVPFGQLAFLNDPNLTRVATDFSGFTGQSIPTGLELYEAAMTELSADERAQVFARKP